MKPLKLSPSQLAAAMRQLGRKGGHARKAALTPERRSQIAKQAALTRWNTIKL